MDRLSEWKASRIFEAGKGKGIAIGILVAIVLIAVIVIGVLKIQWLKKHMDCNECCEDDFEDFVCEQEGCECPDCTTETVA
jgi:hypothetical protein